ncbi:MAG: formylmethanofuran dehydrogenase subunit C [Gammaproteobacteria bacterium]|nr:formylmethanofuran dehydrogenase subunit C [Gammaproteobacteria bacterium]MCI0590302.1 formylmethanofuran dehydrogenase subunit C [Gammaproteobacteria bacterium]
MSLTLTLHTAPEVPLEAEAINPDRLVGLSEAEIAALSVYHGNQQAAIGDFFSVSGKGNSEFHIEGDLTRVKLIGAGLSRGRIVIHGNVGLHVGAAMSGGEIIVEGDALDWVGPEMSGGRIVVKGNAGHLVGSVYRGGRIGMRDGEIIVHGNAGNEVGNGMRNGLIAIGGDCGDFTGVNMLAGTIIVLGELGWRSGAGMKRGTIVSMHDVELLPTFSYACTYQPTFLRLYLLHLQELGLSIDDAYISGRYRRFSGDAVELNRGEALLLKS